ncbi:5,10-methylenetetrahydrofolate reductase [Desulfosporosinus orientis DSM 765]|uniref:Methylenetetrahydrofolate reductase n=1 Tax=Desulfosporosinus orientis (strain ATCC 19365 / DSM 765 / NCIMB 8382 / VKM B-1628 / Singapore I) TaxID=768706 RepID=G7W6Z5_DESOD|nr:methylenetetrahydrofolate reductase [Desulfosporosinus orientis]AET69852.1 5,10-methylenetetrahydrofolate reductase [Desulfosporosinus orientis DSM 765]
MAEEKSKLQSLFEQGEFAVTCEIGPPKNAQGDGIRKHTEHLKPFVDAVNLTDNQTAIVRLSSIGAGVHVLAAGGEPIIQMTTRDRNRIALQSDLLGAYSLGVRNVLCLSGDHQAFGNHQGAKNVYDLDSIQLIKTVKDMREAKVFQSGEAIKQGEPRFFIGAVANPFADPFEFRVLRLEKKIRAGAQFIQTQCIFDMERFEAFMDLACKRGLHQQAYIMAGVMPIKSAKAAKYMQKNVSGMLVPDGIVERMSKAEDQPAEGVKLCIEQIKHLRTIPGVRGVHIMAVAWEEIVPEIVKGAGLLPRP